MANRIVLYDGGKNPTLVGTADGQVPTWNNTTQAWTAQAGGGGSGTVTSVTSTSALLTVATGTTTPALTVNTGTTSSTVAIGDDTRFNPGPSGAGKIPYDNGTGYSAAAAGTSTQVLIGGAAPSFGAVNLATMVTGSLPATSVSNIPYDVSGEYPGTPDPAEECFHFIAVRACAIKATGSRGYAVVAPSGGAVSFDLKKNGTSFGSIDFANGSVTGTVTITSGLDVSVADGDRITIVAPANLYTMETPFWTLKAVVA